QDVTWSTSAAGSAEMRAAAATPLPTVDETGVLVIGADVAPGRYTITATSTRVDGVAGSIDITVVADATNPGGDPGGETGCETGGHGGSSTGTGGSALAGTGGDGGTWLAAGLIALLITAAGAMLVSRRRRTDAGG